MDTVQRVRKTDLARNTRQVIRDVLRGKTAVIENHGQEEVAIIDIIDYRILKAFIHFYGQNHKVNENQAALYQTDAGITEEQERYDQIIASYLAELVSLSRAAELLDLPVLDLRMRFVRLRIPLRMGVSSLEEIEENARNAENWSE